MTVREVDTLIVGGGVVGMSVGYGLATAGERVRILDGADDALRAARGNFGLVWVQGKGIDCPDYARWSMRAAKQWSAFAQELTDLSGVELELSQVGGLIFCLSDAELAARVKDLRALRDALGGDYPFEVLDHRSLKELSPFIGPDVVGATYGPLDGHVSPLRVLRGLFTGFQRLGGQLASGVMCERIEHRHGQFHVWANGAEHVAGRLVLAAGLGSRELAPAVGLFAPLEPNRGQLLVTERMQPFLKHPSGHVRQTGEGVVQIGDSKEDVGFDNRTTVPQLSRIAARARRMFPVLENVNIVRTWGALRVMTPDGYPIYQESETCPGAFLVTCHSGVTLASVHAGPLTRWMRGDGLPQEIRTFRSERFDV